MRLRDVKRGDRFIEEDRGRAVLLEATETAREVNDAERSRHGHECRARVIRGGACMADEAGVLTLFECHNPGGYGLNLYPANTVGEARDARQGEHHGRSTDYRGGRLSVLRRP